MKAKHIFSVLAGIHILIGIALVGMHLNIDEVLKQWVTSEISPDLKAMILAQLRVVIVHSVGVGIIMLTCRSITNTSDARKVFKGYCLFCGLVISNAIYGAVVGHAPPMPVFVIYCVGMLIGLAGATRAVVESASPATD